MLSYIGVMHLYFNKHLDFPRVWCIANEEGTWEINVASLELRGQDLAVYSHYEKRPSDPNHIGPPSAYFIVLGHLNVDEHGRASITA